MNKPNTADYHIEALPIEGKNWDNTDKIEISLNLMIGTEKRVFKGVIGLHGIIRGV